MKKTTVFLIPILFFTCQLFSQEETITEKKWAVKAYVNGSFYSTQNFWILPNGVTESYLKKEQDIGKVSLAVTYTKGKFVQELELVDIQINRTSDLSIIDIPGQNTTNVAMAGGVRLRTGISLRYVASGLFKPFKNKKISLGIGGAVQPNFNHYKYKPATSAEFPSRSFQLGIRVLAVPQIEYDISRRFFINASSPFEIFDFTFLSEKTKNPFLVPERDNGFSSDFFPQRYHFRIGLGLRF